MSSPAPENNKLLSDRIRKEWHLVSGLLVLLTLLFSVVRDDGVVHIHRAPQVA